MTDMKGAYRCERKERLTLLDYFTTCLMVVAVLALFAIAYHELSKPGGALDHALGVTVKEIQQSQNLK